MNFQLPKFTSVDFTQDIFVNAPDVKVSEVKKDGAAPKGFFMTSASPEYFKIKGQWVLPTQTAIECTAVVRDNNTVEIVKFRNLKVGDKVVFGNGKRWKSGSV